MSTEPQFTIQASHPDAIMVVAYFVSLCGIANDAEERAEANHLCRTFRSWRDDHPSKRNFDAKIVGNTPKGDADAEA